MNTSNTILRAHASFVAVGLASLLGGCIIDAKIGDDPVGGSDEATHGETEGLESSTSSSPGYTSGPEPGTASATTTGGNPGTVSATSHGDASASATSSGDTETGVDQDTALELCGVVVVPPVPGGPLYQEGIECELGCTVDLESSEPTGLYEQGQCVCDAMACGELFGGTTGELPGDTETEPDGCGPFPAGDGGFTCVCEMCSIDVTNVDAAWVEGEADLQAICECMCGGAGCGAPA